MAASLASPRPVTAASRSPPSVTAASRSAAAVGRRGPTNRLIGCPVRVADRGLASATTGSVAGSENQIVEEESVMSEEAFIYEAIRTPRGKQRNGSLNEVKPLNLVVGLVD